MSNHTFFTLFSHKLNAQQIADAKKTFGVNTFISITSEYWSNIPPDAISLEPYIKDIKAYLLEHSSKGDILLVQGDFGATFTIVNFAHTLGLIAVYATTNRICTEEIIDNKIIKKSVFEHIQFRKY